jgi:hypothetical protein
VTRQPDSRRIVTIVVAERLFMCSHTDAEGQMNM